MMTGSPPRRTSTRGILPALAAACLWACDGGDADSGRALFSHEGTMLETDLVIGADLDAAPEFQFVRIQDVLPLDDGSFWVIDRLIETNSNTSIRRYDASGAFLGEVGQLGDGPGDFRRPVTLAQLDDGRVLVTDQLFPRRLTLFHPDGTLDEVVQVRDAYPVGPSGTTFMDDAGLVWRWSVLRARPGPDRPPAFWSRMRIDGTVVDTVHPPQWPQLNSERVAYESPDGRLTRGFSLPYRPRASWAVSRSGDFLIVPEDEYRVYRLVRANGGQEAQRELFISRDIPRVAVSETERAALRDETRADIADFAREREISLNLEVPEVPFAKPFVRGLWPLRDGGAMVRVSTPSIETPSGWVEPNAWDVFDENGRFMGGFVYPDGHGLQDVRDGNVWTVFRDELGIPSVHRHPLPF